MTDMADMPENQNFYILQHGIRWTAMPGWRNVLSEQQTWQTFLSHIRDLPPVQAGFCGNSTQHRAPIRFSLKEFSNVARSSLMRFI